MQRRLLILGGTREATALAAALPPTRWASLLSLAGRTRHLLTTATTVRRGSFGGIEGLVAYLQTEQIDAVVDATHPFAAQISQQAAIATHRCQIPRLLLVRPPWEPQPGDRWLPVPDLATAAATLPELGPRIFLTTGRQSLATFAPLPTQWFLMRMLEPPPPDFWLPPGKVLCDRPPFTVAYERDLLQRYQIQALVTKNSAWIW
jgi:precorrin-6A/cobalt-precorrin-6A reductase